MSAIITNYRQLDVAFLLLNNLRIKLRTAGVRISVRKVGNVHRITVSKQPTVATIEQIVGATNAKTETRNLSSNNAISSPTEITSSTDDTRSENGANIAPTVNKEIEDNSVVKVITETLSESTSPLDESHTGYSKDIICDNTAEIITNSTNFPTPAYSSLEITNISDSPELANLENLQTLTLKRLRKLAKLHKVPGFSRMKEEKLVTKLHGLAIKELVL
ncbi:hypothetical protein [Trichormus azollae]|jgi:hypothetical protein|uniref:Uncharacterized protein n=1 Tax=Nostoc azollae (strain 0708) TaxID=551115 RepID=D7E5M9_NOSA0|nr:hypothetical protein [Trichormus azollae]ADI66288.1 hypothetical protein Aazo_5288 ['Nostoc azollae' 0708]